MNEENQIKAIGITSIIIGIFGFTYSLIEFIRSDLISITKEFGILLFIVISLPITIALIASGINLMKHKNWAREVLIILSVLSIISIPSYIFTILTKESFGFEINIIDFIPFIGTIIPIWFLIILLNKRVISLFPDYKPMKQ